MSGKVVRFSMPSVTFVFETAPEETEDEEGINWMRVATDRMRFKRRVEETKKILSPVLENYNKSILIVDIQGFNSPDFVPKELALTYLDQNTRGITHFLFKSPIPFGRLSQNLKNQVRWLERNHHSIKYNSGLLHLEAINTIFGNRPANIVYVKGSQKAMYLKKFYKCVVDLEQDLNAPKLEKSLSCCVAHCTIPSICAYVNVYTICNYLIYGN